MSDTAAPSDGLPSDPTKMLGWHPANRPAPNPLPGPPGLKIAAPSGAPPSGNPAATTPPSITPTATQVTQQGTQATQGSGASTQQGQATSMVASPGIQSYTDPQTQYYLLVAAAKKAAEDQAKAQAAIANRGY